MPSRPQAPQPILPRAALAASVQPQAGNAIARPANFMLKPRGSGQPLPEPVQRTLNSNNLARQYFATAESKAARQFFRAWIRIVRNDEKL
jgi:hypothetical protein